MRNNISVDIQWLIEAKVQFIGELPLKFIAYMLSCSKGNYLRKQRARQHQVSYHKCAQTNYNRGLCESLGLVSDNREEKI